MNKNVIITLFVSGLTSVLTNIAFANSEYEQWRQKTQETYQSYVDERDKEFTSFLKQQWKEMRIEPAAKKDTTPKPSKVLVIKSKDKIVVKKKRDAVIVKVPEFEPAQVSKPVQKIKPEPDSELDFNLEVERDEESTKDNIIANTTPVEAAPEALVTKPEQVKTPQINLPPGSIINVTYFGQHLRFSYDAKMKQHVSGSVNKNLISNFWSTMSRTDFTSLQQQFETQRQPLQLNDWAYALLIHKVASAIYPRDKDSASMFTWFFLIKSGYMARIAYDDENIYLLLPSQQVIKQSHFTFAGVNYYPLDMTNGHSVKTYRVKTYDGQYPGADTKLNMNVSSSMNTGRKSQNKLLEFSYRGKKYSVKVNYDKSTVDFFNTYPDMDYNTYFVADVNKQTGHPILIQLGKIVNGKSEEEAVNLLMSFTQTAFKYKNDAAQFGKENYLFPEETLHYSYSDCEDRVFIFAWLVRNLTGLDVVGLKYPGHFSAAVKFNEKVTGQSVSYKGLRYMITEPTYKGGRVGQAPPPHKLALPTVVGITS